MAAIVWFRQDLRLEDNPALSAALEIDEVVPVFIWAPQEAGAWPPGAATQWWLHHSLISLKNELQEIGLHLVIRQGNTLEILKELAQTCQAKHVYWNRRYEPHAIAQDAHIKTSLRKLDIEARSFNGRLLFEPWTIANKQGKPFQVFTPFWKACLAQSNNELPLPKPQPATSHSLKLKSEAIEALELLPKKHWDSGLQQAWQPGSKAAQKVLKSFIKLPILNYAEDRDRPDRPGVSLLSPYLHFGEISPRMVWQAVTRAHENDSRVECYLRQLGWREFAYHLLYHFPFTPDQPLRSNFGAFAWKVDPAGLSAWQKGLTGYPIVDAGMRQLWTTGWMHNRIRMLVGSFLVKDLRINWLEGAKWFWDTLVDADLANNTLGWQWVGGCGADAAPYFRIFNPVSQGEKFDPDGSYVRRWVPELAALPNKWIHKPWEAPPLLLQEQGVVLGKTYPYPIIDHAIARKEALEAFALLRQS